MPMTFVAVACSPIARSSAGAWAVDDVAGGVGVVIAAAALHELFGERARRHERIERQRLHGIRACR
jgi:hypothetical protein